MMRVCLGDIVLILFVSFLLGPSARAECPDWTPPAGLGGAVDAGVDLPTVELWKAYRDEREHDHFLEALGPEEARARYRIESSQIESGCVTTAQLIDLGRALFLREFTPEEGLGEGRRDRPLLRRFQRQGRGGPDANHCASCHWKGGFAGGGDRVDNAFLDGDGDRLGSHAERNPIALWGSGWIELLGQQMTRELQSQAEDIKERGQTEGSATGTLEANGVSFGTLRATMDEVGEVVLDFSQLEGVDPDFVVRPFGWNGRYATLRGMTLWSYHMHLGLQATEWVTRSPEEIAFGPGRLEDPDEDGVEDELTSAQITAVVAFLSTIDSPVVEIPTTGGYRPDPSLPTMEAKAAPEYTDRWSAGLTTFEEIGCASCHQPRMTLHSSEYRLTDELSLDLATDSAEPRPSIRESSGYTVALFSDLRRHEMGPLEGELDRSSEFITRPLWGLRNSAPYMHDGSAATFDAAIAMHGREGSEALPAAQAFAALPEKRRADLRVFLNSLGRAPTIRIR